MNKQLAFLFLLASFFLTGMDKPGVTKLFAHHFNKLGVNYSTQLELDPTIDVSKILEPLPGYEAESNVARFTEAINQRYQAPLYLKYINQTVGYGVYANEPIHANDIIGEYTGKVISQQNVLTKSVKSRAYIMEIVGCLAGYYWPESLYIDAHEAGNFTRYINHSYTPNVMGKQIFDGKWWHIMLIAGREIAQDQQLLIDYGKNYWYLQGINPIDLTPNS